MPGVHIHPGILNGGGYSKFSSCFMKNVNIISTKKRRTCDINGILWEIEHCVACLKNE